MKQKKVKIHVFKLIFKITTKHEKIKSFLENNFGKITHFPKKKKINIKTNRVSDYTIRNLAIFNN